MDFETNYYKRLISEMIYKNTRKWIKFCWWHWMFGLFVF